jgi:hypothetical protein
MTWRVKGDHNANSWHMRARVWVVCMRVRKHGCSRKGTSGDGDPYTLTLTIANNKWTESEPAGASKVFKTKTGVWERGVNLVSLNKSDNTTKVGHLNGIVPESVPSGATGDGGADETGNTLSWKVQ